jgi:hypothetical protein
VLPYLLTMGSRMILSQKILNSVTTLLFISNLEQKYSGAISILDFFPQVKGNFNFSTQFRLVIWRIVGQWFRSGVTPLTLQVKSFILVTSETPAISEKTYSPVIIFVDMQAFSQTVLGNRWPNTHACPGWWAMGHINWKSVLRGKTVLLLGWLEQPRQDKISCTSTTSLIQYDLTECVWIIEEDRGLCEC